MVRTAGAGGGRAVNMLEEQLGPNCSLPPRAGIRNLSNTSRGQGRTINAEKASMSEE